MNAPAAEHGRPTEPLVNWPRLTADMDARGVDVVVAGSAANVTYLSDYWSLSQWARPSAQAFAVARRGEQRDVQVITSAGGADLVGRPEAVPPTRLAAAGSFPCFETDGSGVVDGETASFKEALTVSSPGRSVEEVLVEVLDGMGDVTVAIEGRGLAAELYRTLRTALPRIRFVDAGPILARTRAIKTEREIGLLRRAAQITEEAIGAAFGSFRSGMSERELLRTYLGELVRRDALPLFTALNTGPRSALPNGQAADRVPGAGELVRIDGGCRYGVYASDIARMAVVGEPDAKQKAYYSAAVAGLEAAIETAGPGVPAAACFDAAVNTVREAGIAHYERGHCGHGIGIENYDVPTVTPGSDDVLQPGMVICLETPYYEIGWGGVQAEDTLLITETGVERFTHQPADLVVVG